MYDRGSLKDFTAWFTTYPRSHRLAGQAVEVVPRALLEEMTQRLSDQSSAPELEEVREHAAQVVESACAALAVVGDEAVATDLRSTFLDLMERATRGAS